MESSVETFIHGFCLVSQLDYLLQYIKLFIYDTTNQEFVLSLVLTRRKYEIFQFLQFQLGRMRQKRTRTPN